LGATLALPLKGDEKISGIKQLMGTSNGLETQRKKGNEGGGLSLVVSSSQPYVPGRGVLFSNVATSLGIGEREKEGWETGG